MSILNVTSSLSLIAAKFRAKREEWFNLIGWWLLGLSMEFPYWIIVTASHDILSSRQVYSKEYEEMRNNSSIRQCNDLSAGFLLIPAVLPSLIVTSIAPFIPLGINLKMIAVFLFGVSSTCLLSANISWSLTITAISIGSLYTGFGISTCLSHLSLFKNNNYVTSWSSGNGASGMVASVFYITMKDYGMSISMIVLSVIVILIIMAVSFWILLSSPNLDDIPSCNQEIHETCDLNASSDWRHKLKVISDVGFTYTLPLTLLFLFQYIISQGLFELIYFNDKVMKLSTRVRWFNFIYYLCNFISRSLGNCFQFDLLWLLPFLQFINMILMTTEAVYGWIGVGVLGFSFVILIVISVGFVAGASYVSTFKKLNKERPESDRAFTIPLTVIAEPLGILLAGAFAIPIHNGICALPNPS